MMKLFTFTFAYHLCFFFTLLCFIFNEQLVQIKNNFFFLSFFIFLFFFLFLGFPPLNWFFFLTFIRLPFSTFLLTRNSRNHRQRNYTHSIAMLLKSLFPPVSLLSGYLGIFNDPTSIPKKFRYIVRTVRWNCSDQEKKTTKQNVQLLQTGQNA